MLEKLENLARHLVDDRRSHRRKRQKYNAVIRNENEQVVFRGQAKDLSRGGAKLDGFPVKGGVCEGQRVLACFLLFPTNPDEQAQWATFPAWVCRVEETENDFHVAVKFETPLAG
jgi:hypothetical protein